MKKRIFSFIFSIFLLCFLPYNYVFAVPENISVEVNGVPLELDVAPVIENGRTLVPVRAICEALGCEVRFYENYDSHNVIEISNGEDKIGFDPLYDKYSINNFDEPLDSPARIINDRAMVPIRALAENLGANVIWDEASKKISIIKKEKRRDHVITSVSDELYFYHDGGELFEQIKYSYPVIENPGNDAYINQINAEFKKYAEDFVTEHTQYIDELRELHYKNSFYPPSVFDLWYTVHTDKDGFLSITNIRDEYGSGAAHGNMYRESRTFDLNKKKELTISDILKGDKLDRRTAIYKAFLKGYFTDRDEPWTFSGSCDNAKFYLKDRSLMLYFDVYEVASHGFGFPMAEIPYSEEFFKIKLN